MNILSNQEIEQISGGCILCGDLDAPDLTLRELTKAPAIAGFITGSVLSAAIIAVNKIYYGGAKIGLFGQTKMIVYSLAHSLKPTPNPNYQPSVEERLAFV